MGIWKSAKNVLKLAFEETAEIEEVQSSEIDQDDVTGDEYKPVPRLGSDLTPFGRLYW